MAAAQDPPAGVETAPAGAVVPLPLAAKRLGKDPRTLIRAIKSGELRGGAEVRGERLRWYVYEAELPRQAGSDELRAELNDLRAQLLSQMEANRLLIATQQNLLDASQTHDGLVERYRSAAKNYLDALAQFTIPGHLGELAPEL